MKFSQRVVLIAIILIVVSAANIVIANIAGTQQNLAVQFVRFCLTCLLAYFLAKGRNWARWLTVTLLGLGSLGSIIVFILMFEKGLAAAPLRLLWLLAMGFVFGAIACFLSFSKRVAAECAAGPPAVDPR